MADQEEQSFRRDLLQWQQDRTGDSYGSLAVKSGLSKMAVSNIIQGKQHPTTKNIKKLFLAAGLDPKYALDFKLRKREFHRAELPGSVR